MNPGTPLEFTEFTQVDEADVVVDGEQIARLLRLRDRVRFEYLPSATRAVASLKRTPARSSGGTRPTSI